MTLKPRCCRVFMAGTLPELTTVGNAARRVAARQ
jgi:hypothetical protein